MKSYGKLLKFLTVSMLLFILCFFWVAIININFSKTLHYYCTDMYTDMMYAVEAWNQKKIFPEGWIFGNQLYAVATPVLAALFYGITDDPCIAMGMASTFMGLGVLLSLYWMTKPMLTDVCDRLLVLVSFMTVVLLVGDPAVSTNGWQLFFTMCSYYACYAIAVFLAFGCYLRSNSSWSSVHFVLFALACVFSFGTGIQSLRQTVVMTLPLAAVEVIRILYSRLTKRKYCYNSTFVAGAFFVSNIAGIVYPKLIPVEQKVFYGSVSFALPSNLLEDLALSSLTPFRLFSSFHYTAMILFGIICIWAVVTAFRKKNWVDDAFFLFILFCIIGVAAIWTIDFLTTMQIREIYYFLLFPMAAICTAWVSSHLKAKAKITVLAASIWLMVSYGPKLLPYFYPAEKNDSIYEISNYLETQGVTTIYTQWDLGEKVAIASDFRIKVGFWEYYWDPFKPALYLCNPSVFDADVSECAYLLYGKTAFDCANEVAQNRSANLQKIKHFPDRDIYVFTADQKMMRY